ncbi:DENN domain-containing protein 1C isoform X2 [Erinaceus europaeus]|uniref:DENN domain-containing protein 1C isoform X2 n=1 Tax=Erinaceus europaeus TaxID=9365 RepID=A0ABM3WLT4_ERIEU|nr:DENN domain-containing protein 1C isoform X2 [Erinaceus europaeus]
MESRAEGDPPAMFDWFFEAACPSSLQEDPPILRQFPPDFRDQDALKMVPKFCFPFDMEREPPSPAVQHFTFALTDLMGTRRFGFCRLKAGAQSCLCILSHLPWFEVFYKLLNTVGDLLAQEQVPEVEELLLKLLQQPCPDPQVSVGLELGAAVTISGVQGIPPPSPGNSNTLSCFVAPDSSRLPSIPENRNLTELVVAVTGDNILGLFAALLAERRVLLTASKLSTLTSCVHASCALLHPMCWEHVLIPTLPPHLLDYCCAPMPYLIGVHASLAERVREKALEDVVVLNVDSNTLETPFDDVQALPPEVVSLLRLRLRKAALAPGEGVSRLFLKAQALLFGGYREALVCSPFIEGRLERLNSGEGFSDLFEQEITCSGASTGTMRSYQLWADSLKKGGGALLHSVKAKTQPAVKNMYRTAKSGLKGVQSLLLYKDMGSCMQRGGSLRVASPTSRSERLQQRLPVSQHFGQNRPLRPSRRFGLDEGFPEAPRQGTAPPVGPEGALDPWAEEPLDGSFLGFMELDLLSEVLDCLNTGTGKGTLRPSQSLDCCHQEGLEYCSSLADVPSSPQWTQEQPPGTQSLPASLSPETTPSQEHPASRSPPEADRGPAGPSRPPTRSADPESLILGPQAFTLDLSPSHPESPPPPGPADPKLDTPKAPRPFDSGSFSEAPGVLPSGTLLEKHTDPRNSVPRVPLNDRQEESRDRSQPRVAELKKCFEG